MNERQSPTTDWLKEARSYLAINSAESEADVIIAGLCDEVEVWRSRDAASEEVVAALEVMKGSDWTDRQCPKCGRWESRAPEMPASLFCMVCSGYGPLQPTEVEKNDG